MCWLAGANCRTVADGFVSERESSVTDIIYEVHRELCFTALGADPPQYSKTTAQGVAERLEAIDTVVEDTAAVFRAILTAIEYGVGSDHETEGNDAADLDTASVLLCAGAAGAGDPFEESGEAVVASENGRFADVVLHNVVDIRRTGQLSSLA